jgi:hypothetical protein
MPQRRMLAAERNAAPQQTYMIVKDDERRAAAMKIRTTADRHIADARSLGGGEKKFPKTPAGKRKAQAHLRKVQAEHDQLGAYTNVAKTPVFADAVRDVPDAYEVPARPASVS